MSQQTHLWLGVFLLATSAAGTAIADDGEHAPRVPLLPEYRQECGECHVAYPPHMLPRSSWQALIADLTHHFGNDASLDAATAKRLSAWLAANGGARNAPPEHRITQAAWFRHEHDEVASATWNLASVKSPANCAACHRDAEQGRFSERDIRIPRR